MNTSDYVQYALALIVGFVVGAGIMSFWNESHKTTSLGNTNSDASATTSLDTMTPTDVVVTDQPAGSLVVVSRVTLAKVGWVAVQEVKDGAVSNALGASLRDVGTSSDVDIILLRPMHAGVQYAVVLYVDDGNHIFERKVDKPLIDTAGAIVQSRFMAQ